MTIPADDPRLAQLWLRKELLASGHNDKSLARALRDGVFVRPRTGAYVEGAIWSRATVDQRHALRVRAGVRQAKTSVVASHVSALPFLEAPTWGLDLSEIHLTRTDERTGRREAGVHQHRGQLREGDTVEAYGVTVSAPIRAALEVSTMGSVEAALVVVDHFLHRRDFTVEDLRKRYGDGMDRWPHSLTTDLVIRLADPRSESVGESRLRYHMWRQGLPQPETQFEVRDERDRLLSRLDFALPQYGAWIEFDGKGKYVKFLRDGETTADAVIREKRREDRVRERTGWRCLRIVWADLAHPEALAARIRSFLGAPSQSPHASHGAG